VSTDILSRPDSDPTGPSAASEVRLGLRANAAQFWLLVLVNAFVGAMVGLERTVLPLLAEEEFGLASSAAAMSFLVAFGLVKAVTNLVSGELAGRLGRRRVLLLGWLAGVPVPFMVMAAPSWSWIVAANLLLGVNQGLAWSMTVVMKIDLAGPRRRGLAMGLNEFAGYVAVAAAAFATGVIASRWGLSPEPFYLGIAFVAAGLALSLLFVRDTGEHARVEARGAAASASAEDTLPFRTVVRRVSWDDRALFASSQAGFVNNLNDGLAWGLFPLFFGAHGLPVDRIGLLAAAYPVTWGIGQLVTGPLSDRWGRKRPIVAGMGLQGLALLWLAGVSGFKLWLAASILLGLGTALVYPTLLAAVGDAAHPVWRAQAVGVYRFWRDAGYAAGAIVAGVLADRWGAGSAIAFVGALTLGSGAVVAWRMPVIARDARRSTSFS
jgi:MFS family permease